MTSDAGSGRIRYRHNFQGQLDDTMKYITAMPNKTLVEVLDVVCAKYGQRLDFIAIYSSTWDLELFSIMARKISFESILLTAGTVSAPDVLWAWLTVNLAGNQWRKFPKAVTMTSSHLLNSSPPPNAWPRGLGKNTVLARVTRSWYLQTRGPNGWLRVGSISPFLPDLHFLHSTPKNVPGISDV